MSENYLILPKFKEYRFIVQGVKAKHQSNNKYKQNLSMKKLLKCIFHCFTIPYSHTMVLESYGRVTPNKISFKTGLIIIFIVDTIHSPSWTPFIHYQHHNKLHQQKSNLFNSVSFPMAPYILQ